MNKLIVLMFCKIFLFYIGSCSLPDKPKSYKEAATSANSKNKVVWLHDSTGGSQQDTLRIIYPFKDCTNASITIMMISDSVGGSQPDTTYVSKVFLKHK